MAAVKIVKIVKSAKFVVKDSYSRGGPDESVTPFITSDDIVKELLINRNSPLHIACKLGNLDKVRKTCQLNYIDSINIDGETPLHIVCRLGHEELCEYITKWAIGDIEGNMVWHQDNRWLVENFVISAEKVLVSNNIPSILIQNKENNTPFQVALKYKKYSCAKIIAELPKFSYILLPQFKKLIELDSKTLIIEKSFSSDLDISEFTENTVMLSGELYYKYMKECTEIAHDYKQKNYFELLAYIGLSPKLKNDAGEYPIETLIENSDKGITVLKDCILVDPCVWHNMIKKDYETFCSFCERLKLFETNKEIWRDLCNETDEEGNLLFHYICRHCSDKRIIQIFSQCDTNARNKLGETPLWEAFLHNNYFVCSWLVHMQCDIYGYHDSFKPNIDINNLCKNIQVPEFEVSEVIPGDTLLHAAAASGASEAISFLVLWINVNNLNSKQQYPLHIACKSNTSIEVIHLLRECDISHKDIDGNTPLDLLYKHHPNSLVLMACAMGSSYYIPGVTPTPCSEQELVSIEWFRDMEFYELEKHHRLQNNILHIAIENNRIEIIHRLKMCYPNFYNKYLSKKNAELSLPLHYAAAHQNLLCLQMVSEGCEVNAINELGHTCLYEACRKINSSNSNWEAILIYLVEKLKCDASICDKKGRSILHIACKNGNFQLASFILTKTNLNPNIKDNNNCTPLMLTSLDHHDIIKLLIEHGADTSYLYDMYKEFFKRYQSETPPPTPLNIIVAGKPSSGKSTLIKALCSDGSQTIVEAEPHTAGIIPSSHHSDQLGCVSFYDLAGQSQYYASHEAVLHTVMASSTPLILLLIDSRKDQGLIQQDILYWLHFFKCQMQITSRKIEPQVILIFSFADQIPDQLAEKKIHCSEKFMSLLFTKTKFCLASISFLDCRVPESDDIKQLCRDIDTSASILRNEAPIDFLLHCFYAFLLHSFKLQPAIRIYDVVEKKEEWISSGIDPNIVPVSDSENSLSSDEELDVENEPTFEEENPANLLPDDTKEFVRLSKNLHQKGHIIFIEDRNYIKKVGL